METLKDILWPIVVVGGLGAFIDFLIGRTGQQKAKDFLLKWWVRFDDVRWKNFVIGLVPSSEGGSRPISLKKSLSRILE